MKSVSCNVRVVSVTSNEGGEGSTAVLGSAQGGGIDITPGDTRFDEMPVQITADAAELIVPGRVLRLTLSAVT